MSPNGPKLIQSFLPEKRGSVAVPFSLGILSVIAMSGLAIDYGRAVSARADLQLAADAASLVAARHSDNVTLAKANAQKYLKSFTKRMSGVKDVEFDASKDAEGNWTIKVKASVPTVMMSAIGHDEMSVGVTSTATAGMDKFQSEIVRVLDNTGSMYGDRINALKKASNKFIDIVKGASKGKSTTKIGIVPFGQYVNIGMPNRHQTWLSGAVDRTEKHETCKLKKQVKSKKCWTEKVKVKKYKSGKCYTKVYYKTVDGRKKKYTKEVCEKGQSYWVTENKKVCKKVYGPDKKVCKTEKKNYTWHGCVGSRSAPNNLVDKADASNPILALPNEKCTKPLQQLTNNYGQLKSTIESMNASGSTYMPAGIMWGWRVLSPDTPFTEASNSKASGAVKTMVVMTDGMNTRSQDGMTHDGSSTKDANAMTLAACKAAKKAGITIYTIAFLVTDKDNLKLLEDCASTPGNAFTAANTSSLETVFGKIGTNLAKLRLVN